MTHPIDTIVAIATPHGVGGLGIVRLSGPQAIQFVSERFPSKNLLSASSHTLHAGILYDEARPIDQVVVSVFRQPRSFTGEDVVEISCHGSSSILKQVVHMFLRLGARLARAGEFSERAFLNGKMDLAQTEAVANLVHAHTVAEQQSAFEQLRGVLSKRIHHLRNEALDALAHVEASLDFSDQEVPVLDRAVLARSLVPLTDALNELLQTGVQGQLLREGVRVVLAGRPNAGKSCLFNALLASERAIVTDIPGTTRDTLQEQLEWNGLRVILTDTAGLRSTSDRLESLGIERSRQALETAHVIVFVVDASMEFDDELKLELSQLSRNKTVVALNKTDLPRIITKERITALQFSSVINVSALIGQGLSDLQDAVTSMALGNKPLSFDHAIVTQTRHLEHLNRAKKNFDSATRLISSNGAEESIALELRAGLEELGAITGQTVSDDLLSQIFSRFCIGK